MKRVHILCIAALALAGCTSKDSGTGSTPVENLGCALQAQVISGVSAGIANSLQCSNRDAVMADVSEQIGKIGICKAPSPKPNVITTQSVGSDICGMAAGVLIGGLAQGGIPGKWGCSAENAQALLRGAATDGCKKVFP